MRARCDDVLDDARASGASTDEFDAEEKRKRDEKAKAAGGTSKGYSSKKERQREEVARRKKEMKREEVRRRRQEAEAVGAAGRILTHPHRSPLGAVAAVARSVSVLSAA